MNKLLFQRLPSKIQMLYSTYLHGKCNKLVIVLRIIVKKIQDSASCFLTRHHTFLLYINHGIQCEWRNWWILYLLTTYLVCSKKRIEWTCKILWRTNPTQSQPLLASLASIMTSSFSITNPTFISIHTNGESVTGNFNAFFVPSKCFTSSTTSRLVINVFL